MKDNKLSSQGRILRLVELLSEDVLEGKSNKNLSESIGKTHDIVSRDLALLKEMGWAEQLANRNWRVTPAVGQLAHKISTRFQNEYLRLNQEQVCFI